MSIDIETRLTQSGKIVYRFLITLPSTFAIVGMIKFHKGVIW